MKLNRIYNEDCRKTMAKMPDNFVDLVVTSPPYDNLRSYNLDIENTWNEQVWNEVIELLFKVVKKGGIVVWIVGDAVKNGSETGSSFKQALKFLKEGFLLHDTMIYQKNNFANPSKNRYHQTFEYMFVFSKGKPKTFNPIKDRKNIYVGQKAHGKNRTRDGWRENKSGKTRDEFGMRHNVWLYTTGGGHMTKDREAYKHPAIFPEKLVRDHVISWSNKGEIIYDPFIGSGTTGKVAIKEKRFYIGSDINNNFCELSKDRILKHAN